MSKESYRMATKGGGFLESFGAMREGDNHVIIEDGGDVRTWRGFIDRQSALTRALQSTPSKSTPTFGIISFNRIEWFEIYFAALNSGCRLVPISWQLLPNEISYIIKDAGIDLIFYDEAHTALFGSEEMQHISCSTVALGPEFEGWLTNSNTNKSAPSPSSSGSIITYTSGTTGRPKGLDAVGRRSIKELESFIELLSDLHGYEKSAHGSHLVLAPFDHGAPAMHAMMAFRSGQRLVITGAFDPMRTLELIEQYQVTTTNMVPTHFIRMLKLPQSVRQKYDLSSLKTIYHGAAPCPEWVKREMTAWVGPILTEYYGAKETTIPLICTSVEWLARPSTVGRDRPGLIETKIIDGSMSEAAPGDVGTVYFKTLLGPPDYRGDVEKSRSVRLDDEWFTVGDIGYKDAEGYLFLKDRTQDVVIVGGVNVYPKEIEDALLEHPSVRDAGVVGMPDDELGEKIVAFISFVSSRDACLNTIKDWCSHRLARFKRPSEYFFREALPRDENGKLRRFLLKKDAMSMPAAAPSNPVLQNAHSD